MRVPEIDLSYYKKPDNIDKVPIHRRRLYKALAHLSHQRRYQDADEHPYSDKYMRCMEACDGKEGCAVGIGLKIKAFGKEMGIFIHGEAEKECAEDYRDNEPLQESAFISMLHPLFTEMDRETGGYKDNGHYDGNRERDLWRPGRRPG